MQDIVFAAPQRFPNVTAESPPNSKACVRSVCVERDTSTETNHAWFVVCAIEVRRDDVDVVTSRARLPGEEVHMLADPSNVRVVVLRHQRDAERSKPGHPRLRQRVVRGS